MTRDDILRISKLRIANRTQTADAFNIIVDYCIEKGKDKDASEQFATLLLSNGLWSNVLDDAIVYFEKKYHICKVYKCEKLTHENIILIF